MAVIIPDQKGFIAKFNIEERAKLNPKLFERSDEDIIRELENLIRSCQRDNKYFTIKVESFEVITDYHKINTVLFNYYESIMRNKNKNKAKKKENQYEYINLNDSDIQLLVVKYYIRAKDEEEHLTVYIEVPRLIDKYYFKMGGGMYSALYQILEGSTYNNATSNAKNSSVTLKIIFMATRIYRQFEDIITTKDEVIKATHYMSRLFNKSVSGIKYILAKYGYYDTISFLGLYGITVTDYDLDKDDHYTFRVGTNIFINVPKQIFESDAMTQSMVVCLCKSLIPGMKYIDIFSDTFWVRILGGDFNNATHDKMLTILNNLGEENGIPDTIDKGYSILDSFENIFDLSSKEFLRLPPEKKQSMYHVIAWMMREFNQLRLKDNLDVGVKRIRCAEYIASLYAMKIAKGIYRVADLNKSATIDKIRKAINVKPNYLLGAMTKCKLVNYRMMVNDMDSLAALKFTYKGVSGLGESSSNSIPNIYRTVNISHIGRIDLDSSSATDPGVTGTIVPFADMHNGFFTDYQEPNFWETEFAETVNEYMKINKIKELIKFETEILNKDKSEDIEITGEVKAMMEQLINPIVFMDDNDCETIIPLSLEEVN